jgi:ribonucleoside-diphosphate reductase alpha chain
MKIDEGPLLPEPQEISTVTLAEKYAKGTEATPDDVRHRVAVALAEPEKDQGMWAAQFLAAQRDGFVPAGRICSAAGAGLNATLINCFVQPIGDSIAVEKDGAPGIYTALLESAETMRRGGGVGYDFSLIRPMFAQVKGTQSRASGPVSYMRIFDRSCETVESAGSRRGAQMAVLRCDHPDLEAFIDAKRAGDMTNFNLSIGVTDSFMEAVEADGEWELSHKCAPDMGAVPGAYQRKDGHWVYRVVRAREIWDRVMRAAYAYAEPGILFLDQINRENNLWYAESITATNPCAEQPLPPYGCCCLGALDLTRFVRRPFTDKAAFDFAAFQTVIPTAQRMLDNALDVTPWPLPQQQREALSKRRIGLGYLGLGDALVMLGLRYDGPDGRRMAARITECLRDTAYAASVKLAEEKGAFPLFDAEKYLSGAFAMRLPEELRQEIRAKGIRNSHSLSIAPTGTISLAFADNASGGIEPAFSWTYTRKKRQADGSFKEYAVEDHAYRMYRLAGGNVDHLPDAFVSALEMEPAAHRAMIKAVAPYVDSAISKTVNVPADCPYEDFQGLYLEAWRDGLKGLATYRPNKVTGSVLSVGGAAETPSIEPDRRLVIRELPAPVLGSLRWQSRPTFPDGNPAWTYMVEYETAAFAVFVGHVENGHIHPFEVWVNGSEQPRGLGAVAKTLSADMRNHDPKWLSIKLKALEKTEDASRIELQFGNREIAVVSSASAALSKVVQFRLQQLGLSEGNPAIATPLVDAMMSPKEPKGETLAWAFAIHNATTGDDFELFLKEAEVGNALRPFSMWLSGKYPPELDGLCKLLSVDMRVIDPAWIGMKLRKLLNYAEPMGQFWARVPGEERAHNWPSTVAFLARMVLYRFQKLGILDADGHAINSMGVMVSERRQGAGEIHSLVGRLCPDCGSSLHRAGGCTRCAECGWQGECG